MKFLSANIRAPKLALFPRAPRKDSAVEAESNRNTLNLHKESADATATTTRKKRSIFITLMRSLTMRCGRQQTSPGNAVSDERTHKQPGYRAATAVDAATEHPSPFGRSPAEIAEEANGARMSGGIAADTTKRGTGFLPSFRPKLKQAAITATAPGAAAQKHGPTADSFRRSAMKKILTRTRPESAAEATAVAAEMVGEAKEVTGGAHIEVKPFLSRRFGVSRRKTEGIVSREAKPAPHSHIGEACEIEVEKEAGIEERVTAGSSSRMIDDVEVFVDAVEEQI